MNLMLIRCFLICIAVLMITYFTGRLFLKGCKRDMLISCAYGLITIFALFFVICLPMVYLNKSVTLLTNIFVPACGALALCGIAVTVWETVSGNKEERKKNFLSKEEILYLGIFMGIVFFQLYKVVTTQISDGDDAFYVAVANNSAVSDTMYRTDPYTGFVTKVPYRYALAPFPILLSIISKMSNVPVSTVSHIVMPLTLIPITYVIYNALAVKLFKDKKINRYIFLSLFAVFAMFGNYSISTAETFMLTRARQGKEALAAIVIPFAFLILSEVAVTGIKYIKNIILIILIGLAAGLCSLFGNIVSIIMLGALFIYFCIRKNKLSDKLWVLILCIPNGIIVLLYAILM